MPIISVVGRKQPKVRVLIWALYAVLSLGAVTMVYPFLLMLSTSFASGVDQNDFRIIPKYFYDESALYRKYVEAKYLEDVTEYNIWFSCELPKFENLSPPPRINTRYVKLWRQFLNTQSRAYMMLGHSTTAGQQMTAEMEWRFRLAEQRRFRGDLDRLRTAYREPIESWMDVKLPLENWTQRNFTPVLNRRYSDFLEFKRQQPVRYFFTVSVDGLYQEYLRMRFGSVEAINKAVGADYTTRFDARLTPRIPDVGPSTGIWQDYVTRECPVHFLRIDPSAEPAYRRFIQQKYRTVRAYNHDHEAALQSLDQVKLMPDAPASGVELVDWIDFLERGAPVKALELRTPEVLFRQWLAERYGSNLRALNEDLHTSWSSWIQIRPPYEQNDFLYLRENSADIRHEFIVRNYREVVDYIALHGRALFNTFVLCAALVLTSLTVNPLCAYALSRFNLRATYRILLFLLATMAFPAEVSAIPSFLLIKSFHLLGTYWALILPGMASGFSIFILKGFFDSLPRELYEAATLDGASEMNMFWNITLRVSTPVLAVIALGAFTGAYGSFMWAFLVCQNEKMWTLMVWLYQMQQWAPSYVVYASLVLAAIPTLLIFIFCQNIIMRGIVIPSEK
ncbi:MAG: carbohydrate ABC transporter permease [Armatimonadetes bacterium]|nr:carbohydrate ABC transporter permease [Armatimonadota bacterium]